MASSALIRFDTTAPTVTTGAAYWSGEVIRVPYAVDEPADIEVTAFVGEDDYLAVVDPSEFVISDVPFAVKTISLIIAAVDDVDNERLSERLVVIQEIDFDLPLTLTIEYTPRTLTVEPSVRMLTLEPAGRTLSIDQAKRFLTVMPLTVRHLTVDPIVVRELTVEPLEPRRFLTVEQVLRLLTVNQE